VPGSHRRRWAPYEIINRLVLIERLRRFYTSEIVILQAVASLELTLFQPPTVVQVHRTMAARMYFGCHPFDSKIHNIRPAVAVVSFPGAMQNTYAP
jgi:hypothetical protein